MDMKSKEILGTASAILSLVQVVVSALVGLLSALKFNVPQSVVIGFVFFVILCAFLKGAKIKISLYLYEWLRYILAPKREKTHHNKCVEYTYIDRNTMKMDVKYSVKFYSGTHDHVEEKVSWTAGKVDSIEPYFENQTIEMIPADKQNDVQSFLGYQFFNIKFSKLHSSKEKPIDVGFKMPNLKDPDGKARTCLIAGIYDKTDKLTLRVRFTSELKVSNIRKLKYANYLDKEAYSCEKAELQIDPSDSRFHYVEFEILRPIWYGKCAIDWDFVN